MRKAIPFVVFLVFLGLWTWKLLEPSPVPEAVGEFIPTDWRYVVSKCAHVGGYTFLTLLAAWLPLRRSRFWVAVGLLAFHGIATEILQHVMGWGRSGKVTDVLIDWFGISLGLIALRVLASGGRKPPVELQQEQTGGLRPPLA